MMTPDEEKALRMALEVALKPFTDALSNIVNPTSERIGLVLREMLSDQLRNAARVWGRAAQMLTDAGLPIGPVPLKILKPILDGASMEEDEDLQERWAALLANASNSSEELEVTPMYADILRQLSSRDVKMLQWAYDRVTEHNIKYEVTRVDLMESGSVSLGDHQNLFSAYAELGLTRLSSQTPTAALVDEDEKRQRRLDTRAFDICVTNLRRLELIAIQQHLTPHPSRLTRAGVTLSGHEELFMTALGFHFVTICHPPEKK